MKVVGVLCALIILVSFPAFGQDKMPPVPKEMQQFSQFLGTWSGPMTITDTAGKVTKATSTIKVMKSADGWGIISEVSSKMPGGGGTYHETDLWSYNGDDKMLHEYLVSNFGESGDYKGNWDNDTSLTMNWSGKMMGQDASVKFVLSHPSANTEHFVNTYTVGGKTTTYEGRLKKK